MLIENKLTEVVADFLLVLAFSNGVFDDPIYVIEYDKRWRKCWPVEVLVDEAVAVETPDLLRVSLHPLKGVAETSHVKQDFTRLQSFSSLKFRRKSYMLY